MQFYVFWGKYLLQVKWMNMIVLILRLYDFKRLAAYWWKVSICLNWMFKVFLITAKNKETNLKKRFFLSFQWMRKLRISKIDRVNVVYFFLGFEVCPPPHLSPSKYVYPTVDIIFIPIIYNIINAVYINRYICSLLKGCYYIEHRLSTSTWTLFFCRKSCSFYQKLSFFREQKKINLR